MITYLVFQFIETVVLKTTCFAISQTINAGTYLFSQLFYNSKRDNYRNRLKHIYLQDVIIHDIRMGDMRSKYIDYADSDDESDNEYEECNRKNTPEISVMTRYEDSMNDISVNNTEDIEKELPPIIANESTSAYMIETEYKVDDALEKQVEIIKEIINDEKYIKEIKKNEQLEKYLNKMNISHETDNEWVNIEVFDEDELVFIHDSK
jgi:uncharacterized protein (DUF2344 family)